MTANLTTVFKKPLVAEKLGINPNGSKKYGILKREPDF